MIVFKAPKSEPCAEIECEYIKRLIGLPGDRIRISSGRIFINGQPLDESNYLLKTYTTTPGSYLLEDVEKIIPEGYYLPLGDNRSYSRDGREFGPVSRESIAGKAWLRYWPFSKIGFVGNKTYEQLL